MLEKSKSSDLYGGTSTLPYSSSSLLSRTTSASGIRPTSVVIPSPVTETIPASFDDVSDHVTETTPKSGAADVLLDTVIGVTFDREVKTVNINKLFEV